MNFIFFLVFIYIATGIIQQTVNKEPKKVPKATPPIPSTLTKAMEIPKFATASNQPVVQYIDALDLVYLDKDGNALSTPVSDTRKIRSVQITLLGRTAKVVPGYKDTTIYTNQQGDVIFGPANDGYRRLLLTTEVLCRNLALR